MSSQPIIFQQRQSVERVEEGTALAPKFDDLGLITTEAVSGVVDLNRAARMRHRPGKVDVEVDGTISAEIEQ